MHCCRNEGGNDGIDSGDVRKNRRRIAAAAAIYATLALCAALMVACQVDSKSWYPSGKATVASFYEEDSSGGKACVATIEIANTGKATINSCTVSISASTDTRTYRQTIVRDIAIPSGKRAYFNVEILYVSESETLKESGLGIVDEYYL
ncbi:MAG TPA: hypothetical protein VN445_14605 [Rectinemataceae bacterium]|nr:hypothetical protein [Rectinemataceae bacterium]